ncbi:MAG: TIGR03790 family protein [Acidobacteriota bacterium]
MQSVRRARTRTLAPALRACLLLTVPAATAAAQTGANVLLVVNDVSAASVQIGEAYARARAVPPRQIAHIRTELADEIPRAKFDEAVQAPIAAWLSRYNLQDRILYLVLTKGVPLRVAGSGDRRGTIASVDSELTLLYHRMLGFPVPLPGWVPNPYFLGNKAPSEARRFTRAASDLYLVTRLDAFTANEALALVERGATAPAPEPAAQVVLDQKATLVDRGGDAWLQEAADRLRAANAGDRVLIEATRAVASTAHPVVGYYSWGSNDPANQRRRSGLRFVPGAIGGMFVSTDGRTFAEPPADWHPSDPNGGGPVFGGSFQSLAGDLIRDGVTGVSAHVAEPYLDATIRPQILFPAYLAGFNLAESFYLAMPYLSWQTVVVGDPLCAPFSSRTPPPAPPGDEMDPETDLPALFAKRRLTILARSGLRVEALKLMLKAEAAAAHGNATSVEALLVRATDIESRLSSAHLRLALAYEQRGDSAKAVERYRRVLATDANNVLALNNLAYALATRDGAPKDALDLATRAYRLSPTPVVADTLGWIQHLLGNDAAAAPLLERAARGLPASADVLVHAAVVHAALQNLRQARSELDAATKLDPRVASRPEVSALRARLGR